MRNVGMSALHLRQSGKSNSSQDSHQTCSQATTESQKEAWKTEVKTLFLASLTASTAPICLPCRGSKPFIRRDLSHRTKRVRKKINIFPLRDRLQRHSHHPPTLSRYFASQSSPPKPTMKQKKRGGKRKEEVGWKTRCFPSVSPPTNHQTRPLTTSLQYSRPRSPFLYYFFSESSPFLPPYLHSSSQQPRTNEA